MNNLFPIHSEENIDNKHLSTPPHLRPHFDLVENEDSLELTVYMPEVTAPGIELIIRGPDLTIRGHKRHHIRPNWKALHLENFQHDYELNLRLGNRIDYDDLKAEISESCLTLSLPKKTALSKSENLLKVA